MRQNPAAGNNDLLQKRKRKFNPDFGTDFRKANHTIEVRNSEPGISPPRQTPLGRVVKDARMTAPKNRQVENPYVYKKPLAVLAESKKTAQLPYAETDTAAGLEAMAG